MHWLILYLYVLYSIFNRANATASERDEAFNATWFGTFRRFFFSKNFKILSKSQKVEIDEQHLFGYKMSIILLEISVRKSFFSFYFQINVFALLLLLFFFIARLDFRRFLNSNLQASWRTLVVSCWTFTFKLACVCVCVPNFYCSLIWRLLDYVTCLNNAQYYT